jgi:beta-xylosidase
MPIEVRRWRSPAALGVIGLALMLVAAFAVTGFLDRREREMPKLPALGPATDVYDGDIGDPFLLKVSATEFIMFGTNDQPTRVPTAVSADLTHWSPGPDALPQLPGWASPDPDASLTWAPAVLATPGRDILYVSVQEAASRRECIAALESPVPQGPYRDILGRPLVCQRTLGGSIDPSVVRDLAGGLHLLWKSDGNCCGLAADIWQQGLSADGLGLRGQPHRLLRADEAWQGGIIEEPAAVPASSGGWWLFYSGNAFDSTHYATGLAYCAKLDGPCRETRPGPFLTTNGRQLSPGGLDTFNDQRGRLWVAYDTWNRPPRDGRYYCCRSVYVAPLLSS